MNGRAYQITLRWLIEKLLWEILHPVWMRDEEEFYSLLNATNCYPFCVECYDHQLCILDEPSDPDWSEDFA